FDSVGWFAQRMDDVAAIASAINPWRHAAPVAGARLRIGIVRDAILDKASRDIHDELAKVAEELRAAGHAVEAIECTHGLNRLNEGHRTLLEYEIARVHRSLCAAPAEQVTQALLDAIVRGFAIGDGAYSEARSDLLNAQCGV